MREAARKVLTEVCGGGTVNCRFTHVYTDGPAPYYTFAGAYRDGADPSGHRGRDQGAAYPTR